MSFNTYSEKFTSKCLEELLDQLKSEIDIASEYSQQNNNCFRCNNAFDILNKIYGLHDLVNDGNYCNRDIIEEFSKSEIEEIEKVKLYSQYNEYLINEYNEVMKTFNVGEQSTDIKNIINIINDCKNTLSQYGKAMSNTGIALNIRLLFHMIKHSIKTVNEFHSDNKYLYLLQ